MCIVAGKDAVSSPRGLHGKMAGKRNPGDVLSEVEVGRGQRGL